MQYSEYAKSCHKNGKIKSIFARHFFFILFNVWRIHICIFLSMYVIELSNGSVVSKTKDSSRLIVNRNTKTKLPMSRVSVHWKMINEVAFHKSLHWTNHFDREQTSTVAYHVLVFIHSASMTEQSLMIAIIKICHWNAMDIQKYEIQHQCESMALLSCSLAMVAAPL